MRIPTNWIDEGALPRDRTTIDAAAQAELEASIAASGLRQPIEVFEVGGGYGLISGYRRLMAVRALHARTGRPEWETIEAVIRDPADRQAALAAMVEENEVRQNLSPWERGRIAAITAHQGLFDTLDAAIVALYPGANRAKRARLRAVAEVVEALEGCLTEPETLSQTRLVRIANTLRLGWGDLIEAALEGGGTGEEQWQALAPVLAEAEGLVAKGAPTRPNRPRRLSRPYRGVTIRRERTRRGYTLHVTGPGANDTLVTEILDSIERQFAPG